MIRGMHGPFSLGLSSFLLPASGSLARPTPEHIIPPAHSDSLKAQHTVTVTINTTQLQANRESSGMFEGG